MPARLTKVNNHKLQGVPQIYTSSQAQNRMATARIPVATPNILNTGAMPTSNENFLAAAVGSKIRITSSIPSLNNTEGTIVSVDLTNDLLILSQPGIHPGKSTFKMITVSEIQSFTILSKVTPAQATAAAKPLTSTGLSPETLQARLEASVAKLKAEEARRGKGVTPEGQKIFDAMSRTMAARWEGTDIIVTDTVIISSPYRVEDCKSVEGSAPSALARIKQVLGKERQKIANKERTKLSQVPVVPAVPSSVEPRKGG